MSTLNIGNLEIPPEYVVRDVCHAKCKRDDPNEKGELTVQCPLTNKWIEINVAKGGIWKCFRECGACPGDHGGGILDFYMLFYDCGSRKDAYKQLQELTQGNMQTYTQRKTEMKKPVHQEKAASPEIRNKTYRAFLEKLPLSAMHEKDLKDRGMNDEDIRAMEFRSIPQLGLSVIAQELYEAGNELKGVPGFYFQDGKPQINCHGSGYFIPYRDAKGNIIALQIRYDIDLTKAKTEDEKSELKKRRYRMFTSSGKEGGTASCTVPFYGIPNKPHRTDVVYATEGGLKASVAQSLSNGWFTAIPGISTYETWRTLLRHFKEQGVKTVVDAFDSDRTTNPSVANAILKLHKIAKDEFGYELKPWNWGTEQKGVDDYLLSQLKKREAEEAEVAEESIPVVQGPSALPDTFHFGD